MKVLTTFSGKYGDILWSMPTVRQISRQYNHAVDFACMPQYQSILPFLWEQEYINDAFVIEDWICTGSPNGDQPWQSPNVAGYDRVYQLTYRSHPGINSPAMPLVDLVARQHDMQLPGDTVPFLRSKHKTYVCAAPYVTYAFNPMYSEQKDTFFRELFSRLGSEIPLVPVGTLSWQEAAAQIASSLFYVGCRSACWVLAMGLGARTITFEPERDRHAAGRFGKVFSCPYGYEDALPIGISPHEAAELTAGRIKNAISNLKETVNG